MRAAVLEGPDEVVVVDGIDLEEPRHGEVAVRIHSCGICHSDVSMIDSGAFAPAILGHEAAGIVEAVGPAVTSVTAGDSVLVTPLATCGTCYWCACAQPTQCIEAQAFSTGRRPDGTTPFRRGSEEVARGLGVAGWSEVTVVAESGVVKLSPDVPLDVVCVIGCAIQTGVGAVLNTARVEAGANVFVTGLGGIGTAVVQGCRVAGAGMVIVSDPVRERRDMAQHFGATNVLDPTETDVVAEVTELTGGVGADYAFEAAGIAQLVEPCLDATRRGGTTVIVGADASLATASIMPVVFAVHGKRLVGTLLGDCHPQRDIPRFVSLWQRGLLDFESMISHRVGLDDIATGIDHLRAARGIRTVVSLAQ